MQHLMFFIGSWLVCFGLCVLASINDIIKRNTPFKEVLYRASLLWLTPLGVYIVFLSFKM